MRPVCQTVLLVLFLLSSNAQMFAQDFDIVVLNGRVMDPDTGFDAIANVGIQDGRITTITEDTIGGEVTLDATGHIVAPGFIDLHAHGFSDEAIRYRLFDGVTTALELEWGSPRIAEWMAAREGACRIHYGAAVSHGTLRVLAMPNLDPDGDSIIAEYNRAVAVSEPLQAFAEMEFLRQRRDDGLSPEETERMLLLLDEGLRYGGLGIGMCHQYYPGATRAEIFRVFQFAAEKHVPIFVHVRQMGMAAMQEVIANAAATGAALHILHVNSMSLGEIREILQLIGEARDRGIDVTTEAYPYTAASTALESAIFDDGWQERLGISYGDLQWQDTGERLTEESFKRYREEKGTVIIHMMKEEWIELAVKTPFVMIASDAMPWAPGAHPRSAGTYARVLGRYVRERQVLDLMTALGKMTIMPAKRMETIAPSMKNKGRVQVGADADLVVFNPDTINDKADFENGLDYSTGMQHIIVSGTIVLQDSELVERRFPGRAIVNQYLDSTDD
ncbi:MAG: amidohydrolase family protein [Pirellulaceae bacterium]